MSFRVPDRSRGTHEVFYVVDGSVRVFVADFPRMPAAQAHDMEFRPDFDWEC